MKDRSPPPGTLVIGTAVLREHLMVTQAGAERKTALELTPIDSDARKPSPKRKHVLL